MILVFGHQKQVGKDTAANAIADISVYTKKVSLAGPLYQICEIMSPDFESKAFYDVYPEKKMTPLDSGFTPRHLLIETGQKLKEIYGKECWVKLAVASKDYRDLIISDLRYKEEAEKLHEYGAVFVKVVRPGLEHTSDTADDDLLDWTGWDHTLVNDGTINDLKFKAIQLYLNLRGEQG